MRDEQEQRTRQRRRGIRASAWEQAKEQVVQYPGFEGDSRGRERIQDPEAVSPDPLGDQRREHVAAGRVAGHFAEVCPERRTVGQDVPVLYEMNQ